MSGVPLMSRGMGGCVVALAVIALGPAAATAPAKVFSYKAVDAKLDVNDVGKYVSDSTVAWDGDGDEHHTLTPPDDELPPLPIPMTPRGTNGAFVPTNVVYDGIETLIRADGTKDPCGSTPWQIDDTGGIAMQVKQKKEGKLLTTWEIPTGIASHACGFGYDQFPLQYLVKSTVGGDIGDDRLVLTTKDQEQKSEPVSHGTITQTVKWTGRVVLKRVKQQFGR